ncbi:MAG: hypothetical protein C5S48_05265 [Candidatus Methanogaster sp.]|nr:MAG: hypothetical protein C5S48_05265 [ANME-2 cluster archaeon]
MKGGTRIKQIALITDDFSLHQSVISEVRSRNLKIVTFRVGEEIPVHIGVVITTDPETGAIDFDPDHIVIVSPAERADTVVDRAIMKLRDIKDDSIIIGIDPGERTGVAVLAETTVLSTYCVPMAEVYQTVLRIMESVHPEHVIIRIGHGARLIGTRIVNSLTKLKAHIELVDETGTTPAKGRDPDIHAAIRIAHLKGIPIGKRFITPSIGEIRSIQDQSREQTGGELTISRSLAERVATGELILKDAILIQKGEK